MKLTLLILAGLFSVGSIWCGRITWIAGHGTGTGGLGQFVMYGLATIIAMLIVLGLLIVANYIKF